MSAKAEIAHAAETIPDPRRVSITLNRLTGRRVEIEDVVPLTEEELTFWLTYYLVDGQTKTLHHHVLIPLADGSDPDRVTKSVRSVLYRHPHLRSVFPIVDDRVVRAQLTMSEISRRSHLRSIDPTSPPADGEMSDSQTTSNDEFDMQSEPPFRWSIVTRDSHRFFMGQAHHVVADGYALSLLRAELETALASPVDQLHQEPPDCNDITPGDVSLALVQKGTDYWYETLRAASACSPSSGDAENRAGDPTGNIRVGFTLSPDTRDMMARSAGNNSGTKAMLLMTYVSALLLRATGVADHIFVTPFFNRRSAPEWRKICNRATVVYPRIRVAPSMRLVDALASVRAALLEAMRNGAYSYCDLADRLNEGRYRDLVKGLGDGDGLPMPGSRSGQSGNLDTILQYWTQESAPGETLHDEVDIAQNAEGVGDGPKNIIVIFDTTSGIRGNAVLSGRFFSPETAKTFVDDLVALCCNSPSALHKRIVDLNLTMAEHPARDSEPETDRAPSATAERESPVAPDSVTARAVCEVLSAACGQPISVTDMFVGRGGSLRHVPAIVTGLLQRGLPVAPLAGLMELTPVSTYVAALEKVAGT